MGGTGRVSDEEFDLHINNGRMLEHFHEGNLTNKSDGIQSKVPEIFVEVSPELAKERGVLSGSIVRLVSPHGALRLPALVTDRVKENELFLPMNSVEKESAINFLTGTAVDQRTNTPAFKQAKVRMEVYEKTGKILCLQATIGIKNAILKMEWKLSGNGQDLVMSI